MILSRLENIELEKRTNLSVGSSGFISLPNQHPESAITWTSTKKIEYLYNAAGVKVKKKVYNMTAPPSGNIKEVEYLDGFQYAGGILQFFPHAEGYVSATLNANAIGGNQYIFNYVYNYTDHLGNIRLSYSKDPVNNQLKILEENHYYPFGLKHAVYSAGSLQQYQLVDNLPGTEPTARPSYVYKTDYQYKYNGKEFQDELGLGLYDYGWRQYDPALGRWHNIDPLAETYKFDSPYAYVNNNPVYFVDVKGMYKMPKKDQQTYSVLASYLKNGISEIMNDKAIIDALKEYGGFTEDQIKNQIIKWDSGIELQIKDLPMNARGCYNDCWPGEGNKPIQINKALAEQLQNATGDDKKAAILAVLMTLLHETVHYGDWTNSNGNLGKNSKKYNTKYGVEAEESEIGKIFEIEAFWGGDYESYYDFKDSDDWNMNASKEVIKRRG